MSKSTKASKKQTKPAKKLGKTKKKTMEEAAPTVSSPPIVKESRAGKRKKEQNPQTDRISIKKDHLKILTDLHTKEQAARDTLANAYLRVRQHQKNIDEITSKAIVPQEEEIYRQQKRIIEIGMSIMDFYDLESPEGFTWQLTIQEGAWILVPLEGNS